jgi:hypothetical protein
MWYKHQGQIKLDNLVDGRRTREASARLLPEKDAMAAKK